MSDIEYLPHLWIPDEEVEPIEKTPRGFSEDRGLDFGVHGATLSSGLQSVMEAYSHLESDSLSDEDIVIFKMVLPEGEDIYAKRDIAEKEGLKINAVKVSVMRSYRLARACLTAFLTGSVITGTVEILSIFSMLRNSGL